MIASLLSQPESKTLEFKRDFRELELVEQWGSGIPGIFRQAAAAKLPEPLIEELAGRVRFTVFLPEIIPLSREQARGSIVEEPDPGARVRGPVWGPAWGPVGPRFANANQYGLFRWRFSTKNGSSRISVLKVSTC